MAQPLRGRIAERHAGSNLPGQRAAARLMEHVLQPRVRRALREPPGRRPAALGPGGPDPALHLATVPQPVPDVLLRTALALDADDVPTGSSGMAPTIRPAGNVGGQFVNRDLSQKRETSLALGFLEPTSGFEPLTPSLRVMTSTLEDPCKSGYDRRRAWA